MTMLELQLNKHYGEDFVNVVSGLAQENTQAELLRIISAKTGLTINKTSLSNFLKKYGISATKKRRRKKMEFEDFVLAHKDKKLKELLRLMKGDGARPNDWRKTYEKLNYTKKQLKAQGRL